MKPPSKHKTPAKVQQTANATKTLHKMHASIKRPPRQAAVANLQKQQQEPQVTTQAYQQASQRFLDQAKQELAAGDLQQASEKGWGAATQMLKAIAEQRSWEHGKHRHYHRIISRLRAETGDRDVYRFFSVANDLHGNFYENEMSAEDIAESLDDVQALLDRLETLLKQV